MATQERVGMALDEFIRQNDTQPFELIKGEKKPKMPTVAGHSEVIQNLRDAINSQMTGKGKAYSETTFILPERYDANWVEGSRIPDVMYFGIDQLDAYKADTPNWRERPFALVPDFVAEVISPTDRYSDVDEKVDVYLRDGVRLVVVLDPQRRKGVVYSPGAQPLHLAGDDTLDGGAVVPGFQILLSSLFV